MSSDENQTRYLKLRRGQAWQDAFEELHQRPPESLKSRVRVQFVNVHGEVEAGEDGGGLFKEAIEAVLKVRGLAG